MSNRQRILVVDDEVNARNALAELLREENYDVETAADAFKALGKCANFAPHLVLTDLKMPGMDGIELIKKLRASERPIGFVVMTAFGAVDSAIEAMRAGAFEYLTKPLNFDELLLVIERTIEQQRLRDEAQQLRTLIDERLSDHNIIGNGSKMQKVFKIIQQVAPSRASVLITGESGTGKELVAAALHHRSQRKNGPFVKLHCAALAETLLESELFGHERGAFTSAVSRRDGRFQMADKGTLFLDEIGEISPAVQVKLLRFLQEHEFERVGGSQTIKVDVRVIAATNRNLAEEVKQGRFREDLYYRLNVVGIEMPPLRERPSDIPMLAGHFLSRYAIENDKKILGMSPATIDLLAKYNWPGNVRELENAIERAVVMCASNTLEPSHLPAAVNPAPKSSGMPSVPGSTLEALERYAILSTLEFTGGSTSKAADILGVSVRKIQYKLHEYRSAPKSDVAALAK